MDWPIYLAALLRFRWHRQVADERTNSRNRANRTPPPALLRACGLLILVVAVAISAALSGCASATVNLPPAPVATNSDAKLSLPLSIHLTFAKSSDEDLRSQIQDSLNSALEKAGIRTASSGSTVVITIESVRRVSFNRRAWLGNVAGSATVAATVTYPDGSKLKLDAATDHTHGYMFGWLNISDTDTAIRAITETIADHIKVKTQSD